MGSRLLEGWVEHWQGQISEHREQFQLGGVVAGTLIVGPSVLAAANAVAESNELALQRQAIEGASKSIAQDPSGTNIGAFGEVQFTDEIKKWIPIGLIFILVMYAMFKD